MIATEALTGSYTVDKDCRGKAAIRPKGHSEMHFRLVVVDGGNEMPAVETDADTLSAVLCSDKFSIPV